MYRRRIVKIYNYVSQQTTFQYELYRTFIRYISIGRRIKQIARGYVNIRLQYSLYSIMELYSVFHVSTFFGFIVDRRRTRSTHRLICTARVVDDRSLLHNQ